MNKIDDVNVAISHEVGSLIMHCGNVYNENGTDISREVGTYIHSIINKKL